MVVKLEMTMVACEYFDFLPIFWNKKMDLKIYSFS